MNQCALPQSALIKVALLYFGLNLTSLFNYTDKIKYEKPKYITKLFTRLIKCIETN